MSIERDHDHDAQGRPVVYVVGWSWTNDEPNLPSSDWDALGACSGQAEADALAEEVRVREHAAYLAAGEDPVEDDPCTCGPEVLVVPLILPAPAPPIEWVH